VIASETLGFMVGEPELGEGDCEIIKNEKGKSL